MDTMTAPEPSLSDILMAINGVKSEVRTSTALQMEKFEELRNDVNSQLTEMHSHISNISDRMSATEVTSSVQSSDILGMKSRLTAIEQEKLSSYMSISGIRHDVIQPRRHDAPAFARELIHGMGITFQDSDIIDAYIFELPQTKTLKMTVIFNNFRTKISVMWQKRERAGNSGIYFENAMIPEVRHLFSRARHVARSSIGLKNAILKSNKVHIVKADDSLLLVNSEADVQRIEREFPGKKPVPTRLGDARSSVRSSQASNV